MIKINSMNGIRIAPSLLSADLTRLAEQVKHLDADVVQVDEANLPGHPDEWQWAAAAINKVLRAVPPKAKAAVHLCFGNYGGQSIQKGTWAKLMGYLNALKADHVPIARPRSASGNVALMMARLPGTSNAAPTPCTARPAIN